MNLIITEANEEDGQTEAISLESHPVEQNEFGEYVASLHSSNNTFFILQYQVYIELQIYLVMCLHSIHY